MELNLKGKTALVTGGSHGLGEAIGSSLAAEGVNGVGGALDREDASAVTVSVTATDSGSRNSAPQDVTVRLVDRNEFAPVIAPGQTFNIAENSIAGTTLANPLDLSAEDGRPVDLVVLIVGPLNQQRQMLQLLARLARLVNDTGFLNALRRAEDAQAMARALTETT